MDLANWALRTSPKFSTGVKHQFHQVFDQVRDPEIPITLRPQLSPSVLNKIVSKGKCVNFIKYSNTFDIIMSTKERPYEFALHNFV